MLPPDAPSLTDQVMPWFADPETVAEKATVWQASTAEDDGPTATDTVAADTEPLTVTVATCNTVASALLAATT